MEAHVQVSRRGEDRIRLGHPWVYRSDLGRVEATGGDTVWVHAPRGRVIGQALYSDRSEIALRVLTRHGEPAGDELWRHRLQQALAYRERLNPQASAYRLVHAEGDLLPSLVVDRYGDVLVVQALSQGVERLLPRITAMLSELLSPAGILARHDSRVRLLEGLPRTVELLSGSVPEVVLVRDGDVEYQADLWRGQKTGLFLDQRENRQAARQYAHGRLLDCFSYVGAFALTLGPQCAEVAAVEIAAQAAADITRNAALNHQRPITVRVANVFDHLRELVRRGEQFETIVLDPPAFAKNKNALSRAVAGYKEINLRALKLLSIGGYLITSSCSHHLDEAMFGELVYEAALDAGVQVTVVEKRMQSRDHPVLLGVPETYYLKCLILRRLA